MKLNPLPLLYGVYAVVMALVLLLLVTVPAILLSPNPRWRKSTARAGLHAWLWAVGAPVRIRGLDKLPDGPCVLVSNHASYLDGPVLTAALPPHFTFVVQHGAAQWPLIGRVITAVGVTYIERESARAGAAQMRALIRRLRQGESFTVFPEGSFFAEPELLPFKSGAFLIAAHGKVPVVPAVLRGTRRFFGDGQWLPSPARLELEIFEPITVQSESRQHILAARDEARAVILRHCGEADGADAAESIEYSSAP